MWPRQLSDHLEYIYTSGELKKMKTLIAICITIVALPVVSRAAPVAGPSGKAQFEDYRDNYGGNFIDFTHGVAPMPTDRRLDSEFTGTLGVTFSTFLNPSLGPLGPHNVYVSTGNGNSTLANTIVGTPCAGCADDGRYSYQIEFSTPQRYAGVQRIWNTAATTAFYDDIGGLLYSTSISGGSEFHGYLADTTDTSTWVSRIEISGGILEGFRQVGYTDDLFFGTTVPVPEPGTLSLLLLSSIAAVWARQRKRAA